MLINYKGEDTVWRDSEKTTEKLTLELTLEK